MAGDRAEVFAPGSISWPTNGVALQARHYGPPIMRFEPKLDGTSLMIDADLPDTPEARDLAAEIRSGNRAELSIHFHPAEEETKSGVREISAALVTAVAAVKSGAYGAQTAVEVRERRRVMDCL